MYITYCLSGTSNVLHVNLNDIAHEMEYNLYSTVSEWRKPMVYNIYI